MSDTRNFSDFPPDYASRVGQAFLQIDALLVRAAQALDPFAHDSPFAALASDTTVARHALVVDRVMRLRAAMERIAARHAMPLPATANGATQAARVYVDQALVVAAGLDPRGGGDAKPLPDAFVDDAGRIVDEMMDLLVPLLGELAPPGSRRESRANPGLAAESLTDLLMKIRDIAGARKVLRVLPAVDALLEKNASKDFAIGVFGALNAGKSSLINVLLGTALLPTSPLPTTVTPICVRHAKREQGRVEFADAVPETFGRERLAEFANAHFNANNERHVTQLRFATPSALLEKGVMLLDFPGIESFAGLGDDMRVRALRCDLAVVLVSSVAPLTLDEAKLIDTLRRIGVELMVLVTKADLMAAEDRWHVYGHVVRALWQKAQSDIPVYLVSTIGIESILCKSWIEGPLNDALERHRQHGRNDALRQQAGLLRDELSRSLERQLSRVRRAPAPRPIDADITRATASMLATLQHAAAVERNGPQASHRSLTAFISEVAHNAAIFWNEDRHLAYDVTQLLETAIVARARTVALAVARELDKLHAEADASLQEASRALELPPADFADGPLPPPAPAFVLKHALPATIVRRTPTSWFGRWGLYLSVRRQITRSVALQPIELAWNDYLAALGQWRQAALDTLLAFYAQRHEIATARVARAASGPGTPADAARVDGFARAGRNGRRIAGRQRHARGIERLGHRAHLVRLDQDSVVAVFGNPFHQKAAIADEQIVADDLHPLAEPGWPAVTGGMSSSIR